MFNVSNLKAVEKANTKKAGVSTKTQNFSLRFRKFDSKKSGEQTKFYVSDKLWAELDLDNKGLKQFIDPENNSLVYLGVVPSEQAKILKGKTGIKGRNFKAVLLDAALSTAGLIDLNLKDKSQYLKLVNVGSEGDAVFYQIVADVTERTENETEETEEVAVTATSDEDEF